LVPLLPVGAAYSFASQEIPDDGSPRSQRHQRAAREHATAAAPVHELISETDFRDFVFANPVRLWAGNNPDFFKGTVVEQDARARAVLADG